MAAARRGAANVKRAQLVLGITVLIISAVAAQRWRSYCIDFAFPGAAFWRSCRRQSSPYANSGARAVDPDNRGQVDQPFPARSRSTGDISRRGTRVRWFCRGAFVALRPPRAFGYHRSALREHFGLPDARFDVDDGLLARGPVDARRSLLFQHERGGAIHQRIQWLLLQLHHTEHRRLRRYHAGFKNCALACGDGSNDRATLCGGPNRTPRLTLFGPQVP
jgi:hypothetical protein